MSEFTNPNPWDAPDTFGKRTSAHNAALPVQWPLKLMRVTPVSPFFHRANLVIAADCTAFSSSRFHEISGNGVLVICCPDGLEGLGEKLQLILTLNDILSITLIRMDAPCCRNMATTVIEAIRGSRRDIPLRITTLFSEGEIVE